LEIEMSRHFQRGIPNDGHGDGRRAGSRNKLQTDFLVALAADFAEHGAGVIRIARIEKPVEYLKVIASVLPRELQIETSALSDMSDEDLAASLATLQRLQLDKVASREQQEEQMPDGDTASTKH
jgi:hypothetical protein